MSNRNIERLYNVAHRNIATVNGELGYDRLQDAIIRLCEVIENTETDESIWCLGESNFFALSDLIVGAYWHFTEWHGGQFSKSYRTLCALGSIFSPGMSAEPEPDSGEQSVYDLLNDLASTHFICDSDN